MTTITLSRDEHRRSAICSCGCELYSPADDYEGVMRWIGEHATYDHPHGIVVRSAS